MFLRALVLSFAVLLFGAGTAFAHVTVHVPDDPPEQGGQGTVVFRVPNEETAATVRVEVALAPSFGVTTARTRPVPGWDATVRRTAGNVVTGVVWTARPGHEIPGGDEHYEDFGLTLHPLPADVDTLTLPATQVLSDGATVAWNDQLDRPAPVLALAEPSAHGHHGALTAAAPSVPWAWVASGFAAALLLAVGGVFLVRRKGIS